ncbi:MAG: hypothetical protein IPP84_12695 [Propionivibrio sp.]|uniref:hypothetical protein n=1 Tax=Propionivibrio sp. TaxID=2212460 RepID=UPI0025DA017F|nr:hypothetical protein [Propionivibrio sp.]MBL0208760.1 hypothetical protein [Propionivibrio sp.]
MPKLFLPSLLLALSLAAPVFAANPVQSDTPGDYAYAMPLQVSGKQGVVGFQLPQAVYLKARTANCHRNSR